MRFLENFFHRTDEYCFKKFSKITHIFISLSALATISTAEFRFNEGALNLAVIKIMRQNSES